MPVTQDRMARLREFGLSEYAARAYLALLDLGIGEARDVSSLSKVPQAKIYHVLEQLHEKGLVVVLPEFPKKYAPVPFAEYLDRLYEEHTKAAGTIEEERDALSELFRVVGDADVGDRGFFTVLRGRRNVLSKVEEMLASTKGDLLLLGTVGSAERSMKLLPEMRRARERGVQMRFLVPIDASTMEAFGALSGLAEVRARDLEETEQSAKVAILVSDARSAFLIHYVPDDGSLATGKDVGVFTDQEAMVAAIRAIVEPHWARAASYADRREQVLTGRAPPFTRIYAGSEEAWRALTESLSSGVKELCAIDGNPAPAPAEAGRAVAARLREAGARFRAVLNLPDLSAVEAHEAMAAAHPGSEVRHLAPRLVTRQWLLDEREAFFSLSREGASDLVIHTNSPPVVRTLREHFEAFWDAAAPLAVRRKELEVFPHLRPGDLGLGVLFHVMGEAVVVAAPDGRVLLWNPAASRVFGRESKDAVGLRLGSILQGDFDVGLPQERAPESLVTEGGERSFEGKALRADGTTLDVEWTLRGVAPVLGGQPFLLAIVRDVSERRAGRDAQARVNERIVRVYESMTEAFFALDREWRFVYRNPVTRRMAPVPDEEILGRNIWDLYPDLRQTRFFAEYHRAMETMRPVSFEEHYPRMGRWFEVNAYPSEEGLSVYFRDVTERRRSEEAARQREAQLTEAERLASLGSWSWAVAADEVAWSEGLCRIHGVEPAKAPATLDAVLSLVHPDDRDRFHATLRGALASGQGFATSCRVRRPDGATRSLEVRGTVFPDEQGRPARVVGVCRDVTGEGAPAPASRLAADDSGFSPRNPERSERRET